MPEKLTPEEYYACGSVMEREVESELGNFLTLQPYNLERVQPLRDALFAIHEQDGEIPAEGVSGAVPLLLEFVTIHSAQCEDEECAFRFLPSAIAKLTS